MNNDIIKEVEILKENFNSTLTKLVKDLKRQEKIMLRSDKRQKREYDELQKQLENIKQLQQNLEELFDAFIKILAEAIDIKSPYTGAHCERVPEISIKLAEILEKEGYKLNLKEIEMASYLHDVGKIITPEYVMDKATKLETIYNRIHEVRMKFEILYRDIKIKALEKKLNGEDTKKVDEWENEQFIRLTKEWEFIANINIGGEFLEDKDIEKLKEISNQEWIRYFDDNLGLSWTEKQRKKPSTTPAVEKLLADKPEYIIPRKKEEIEKYKKFDFKIDIPKNLYNLGEIYNLSIKRGTLTPEEFFKIQEHIMLTILMLEKLPFPDYLKNVPLYAGTHHEKLDGSGYPRKLKGDEIPIGGRIIALADVFEALTSSDRPYKTPKKLSDAIKILYFMVKDNHLDKKLFKLFLKSGLYLEYAKRHLKPEQIDEVDIEKYLNF